MGFFEQDAIKNTDGSFRNDFEGMLGYALQKLRNKGLEGIGAWVAKGDKHVEDRSVLTFRDVSMTQPIFDLAVEMNRKGISVDPHVWAAWMHNSAITYTASGIKLLFMSGFRAQWAREKLGDAIGRHYAGQRVEYLIDRNLDNQIRK